MSGAPADYGSLLRFRDQIRKETLALRKARARSGGPPSFALNPLSLRPVAASIGTAPPEASMNAAQLTRKQENVEALRATLALSGRAPRDRYAQPMTSAQEIGWHASRHTAMAKPLFLATHHKSDIAQYGEDYATACGCGPFNK